MGYRLAADRHIAAAQMLGARMAREDGESPTDAAQDAVVAYLEQVSRGTIKVTRAHIMGRLLGDRPGNRSRPLLTRSYGEQGEELPEWAL